MNIRHIALSLIIAAAVTSCGHGSEQQRSEQLLAQVNAALDSGNYARALTLVTDINEQHPEATDLRRQLTALTPRINEGLYLTELTQLDSLCAANSLRADSLGSLFRRVDNEIEPYLAYKGEKPGQGLTARLSPEGMLYIISTLRSPRIGHTGVSVATADGSVSAATPAVGRDGERNAITDGAETIHFIGVEADTVAHLVHDHAASELTLTFTAPGGKSHSQPLAEEQRQAIAAAYEYAATVREGRVLHLRREAAERKLAIARNQRARLDTLPSR